MIEIAIAIAVIGFALVAIIGILPQGLNTQKDNREDTIISQDGPYFLDAIRNARQGLLFLAQKDPNGVPYHVESITINRTGPNGFAPQNIIYTNDPTASAPFNGSMTDGTNVIGLLSTPRYETNVGLGGIITNDVTARVRALNGSALEQGGANSFVAFRYLMNVQIVPFGYFAPDADLFTQQYTNGYPDAMTRANRALEMTHLRANVHEIRLQFNWPVLPNGAPGPNKQMFRTVASGQLVQTNFLFSFQPQSFSTNSF